VDLLSFFFALVTLVIGFILNGLTGPVHLIAVLFAVPVGWFLYLALGHKKRSELPSYVLKLGGVTWKEADFCRGWEIDGRTGSGKTASGVIPIIHALKKNRPNVGIMALDTKGDLSEPLEAVAKELKCEGSLRQLEVRPDQAAPNWTPLYTMNMLADASIPYSTYAKILVDVATALARKAVKPSSRMQPRWRFRMQWPPWPPSVNP
jgi:hypothetical protein